MFINIKKAIKDNVFYAPDSVTTLNVADTQMVYFSDAKPESVKQKVGEFMRVFKPKKVQKYKLMVVKNRTGILEFQWFENVKPENSEILVQKLIECRSY